jgi:Flp pilus assembly protein TadD
MLSPINMHSLRERHILPSDELVAAVCALWITRVTVPPPSSGSMRAPAHAAGPPSARSGTLPPFVPPTTSMLPPRRDSGFQRAVEDPTTSAAKETAMERKVEEAWMTAEADPSRAQQISAILVKAVGVFPRNPRLRYFLARLHIQAHRLEEAMKELQCALELDPGDQSVAAELEKLRDVVQASPHR